MRIGTDPEFFLTDPKGNLVSAIPVIQGTKQQQFEVEGGGLQHDNVAAEFSCDPSDSEEAFVTTIGKMLKQLAHYVEPLVVNAIQSADFPKAELESQEAQAFGCDPDFDAYDVAINTFDASAAASSLRSCGGHIHVGVKNGHPKVLANGDMSADGDPIAFGKIRLVKAMDLFLGVSSLLMDSDPAAARRRELYGKAGCHRPKDYGVEYRTLSNFWTKSPDMVRLIYRLTVLSAMACDTNYDKECFSSIGSGDPSIGEAIVRKTIDNSNVERAKEIVSNFVLPRLKKETLALYNKAIKNGSGTLYDEWGIKS